MLLAVVIVGCGSHVVSEPLPDELLRRANANLMNAGTAHVEGTMSASYSAPGSSTKNDLAFKGDVQMPDSGRVTFTFGLATGAGYDSETLIIAGRTFIKPPLTQFYVELPPNVTLAPVLKYDPTVTFAELRTATNVIEVERVVVDGRKTRHLSYVADATKLRTEAEAALRPTIGGQTGASLLKDVRVSGEVWVRVDDEQIVRQISRKSYAIEGPSLANVSGGFSSGASSSPTPRVNVTIGPTVTTTSESTIDVRISKFGAPAGPSVTVPPTFTPAGPAVATPAPSIIISPSPRPSGP